jgi:hypothetical protein
MYFQVKNIFKNNFYYVFKHAKSTARKQCRCQEKIKLLFGIAAQIKDC